MAVSPAFVSSVHVGDGHRLGGRHSLTQIERRCNHTLSPGVGVFRCAKKTRAGISNKQLWRCALDNDDSSAREGASANSSELAHMPLTRATQKAQIQTRRSSGGLSKKKSVASMAWLVLRSVLPIAIFALAKSNPAMAAGISGLTTAWRSLDPSGFTAGLTASFVLVLASEIGDKTFFISALLSMKYSRVLVLIGTMLALGSMTVISVVIGQVFHALPTSLNSSIPFDDYAAAALLLWFGFQNLRDGLAMSNEEDEELRDAEEVVEGAGGGKNSGPTGVRVVTETSSLIFLAEWGDKSMLATVALAAAKSPLGVIVGGISGHFVASIIAVVGGSFLGKYISEKNARIIGGVLFWIFAILTIFNLF